MDWTAAQDYCESNHSYLVNVRNSSENDRVSSLASDRIWIGLRRKTWNSWSDQSPVTFTHWSRKQPDNNGDTMESCAAVNATTGTWWDVNCNTKQHFVCQDYYILRKTTFKLKFKSEANLNHPAVKQQILDQVLQDGRWLLLKSYSHIFYVSF